MFSENIENAKMNLQGRTLKSFFVILESFLSFFVFVLSSFSCVYLLVVDTELLSSAGVFDNKYIHVAVCALAVIENIILFMLHIYIKLKKDVYFYFTDESIDIQIPVRSVVKACHIYSLKTVKKFLAFLLYICPFSAVSVLIFSFLQHGISYFLLILFSVCDFVLLIAGVYSYSVYIQKYELLPFVLIKYQDKNTKDIFNTSAKIMNGKCRNMLRLKFNNFPKIILCLFIFPCIYYLPYCKTVESDYILSKEKPYMRRNAHTEKPVVFYFEPIKEN